MCFPLRAVAIFILALGARGDEDAAQSEQCAVAAAAAAIMETAQMSHPKGHRSLPV